MSGWIVNKYIDGAVECSEGKGPIPSLDSIVVGTWNLEHFRHGSKLGFPGPVWRYLLPE